MEGGESPIGVCGETNHASVEEVLSMANNESSASFVSTDVECRIKSFLALKIRQTTLS